jgi:hypothetical protein
MIKAAIEKVLEIQKVEKLLLEGRTYTNKPIFPVYESSVATIQIKTLTGIIDYITDCIDDFNPKMHMIHIVDHEEVCIVSKVFGAFAQREIHIKATALLNSGFSFSNYMDLEKFIIELKANFVRTDVVEQILDFISSVDSDAEINKTDDGFTQRTTVKQGVALHAAATVPNPVTLAPYRTFLEIDQPESQYIFRIKNEDGVKCALFEAGGGQWKLETIAQIKNWLECSLETEMKIIA